MTSKSMSEVNESIVKLCVVSGVSLSLCSSSLSCIKVTYLEFDLSITFLVIRIWIQHQEVTLTMGMKNQSQTQMVDLNQEMTI